MLVLLDLRRLLSTPTFTYDSRSTLVSIWLWKQSRNTLGFFSWVNVVRVRRLDIFYTLLHRKLQWYKHYWPPVPRGWHTMYLWIQVFGDPNVIERCVVIFWSYHRRDHYSQRFHCLDYVKLKSPSVIGTIYDQNTNEFVHKDTSLLLLCSRPR